MRKLIADASFGKRVTISTKVRLFRPAIMFVVMHMCLQRHGRQCKENVLTIG
jgi:hypothetical protein